LRDVADPDSEVSRRLGSWIAHWSEHRQEIAIELSRSRDNAIEVKPVLERYASLREAIPLAEHVRDLSIASMEAMNYVAEHRAPSKAWVTRQRQLLERTSVARADLTVTLVGTLRTLLDLASATR